jgi:hypothetical protein
LAEVETLPAGDGADLTARPEHRAERAAFLTDMRSVLGSDALAALGSIAERLGLDYGSRASAKSPNRDGTH